VRLDRGEKMINRILKRSPITILFLWLSGLSIKNLIDVIIDLTPALGESLGEAIVSIFFITVLALSVLLIGISTVFFMKRIYLDKHDLDA